MATGAHVSVFLFCFVLYFCYLLAAFVFYGWPALLTFGFSGNMALLLLVLRIAVIVVLLSQRSYPVFP